MANSVDISGLSGETVVKQPGAIQGAPVVLSDLEDCEIYILDFSSSVEVVNVASSKIFIGPVGGTATFDNVRSSTVAVAAQQVQIKGSENVDIGLYSAEGPQLAQSSNIRISCWMGAYPGLTDQFHAASLDPLANAWDKAVDADSESNFGALGFELVDAVEYWEPPLDGYGPPDNPVPTPDGTHYSAPADANGDFPSENGHLNMTGGTGAATLGTTGTLSAGSGGGLFSPGNTQGLSNTQGSQGGGASPVGDHPKVAAMKEKMRQRTLQQESDEASAKQQLGEKANQFLESFYQRRQAQVGQRAKDNRASNTGAKEGGGLTLEGSTPWEKTLGLINFNFLRANAADKARFKTVLFSAKANNTATGSKS